ncbi:FHA domain-containing protein [Xiamenia xianingshaonis]|uniref:FHA domain-containing protein n=1 Tax=Xiamenia xianingshaonis TaxID=2682776 RepID=A0A9E6MPA4_9ACTN|nr:FHA domain-containing protein [Xiamenia xianingshaonis]NGM17092.1 FHA domain-containing protein [Eggerthellaceae bacterium zg-893]NHM13776.1 FHA domain-containing protein [Xiamenia xianingshaonis]NHM16231.1 FHA domain-containing protein [Xiamenia xianingshaonis]QTU83640.1 FHA domain-containing protein [Xiamenia xianingshaonis]
MSIQCPVCSTEVAQGVAVCPACGFNLVGATQRFEPIRFEDDPVAPVMAERAQGVLHVVRGPQSGIVFRLGDDVCTVGRNPHCGIFLNDMTVSRDHAVIEPLENGYIIRDRNSFNGVWVNNKNIESHVLQDGDILQIGTFCLVYKEE